MRTLVILASLLAACVPDYGNGELRCSVPDHRCPDGYHCSMPDDTCWTDGLDPDLSVGGDDLSGPDDIGPDDGAADGMVVVCDPVAQSGCAANQKCAWIRDQAAPGAVSGHIGCAPDGPLAFDGACTWGPSGGMTGYDNCEKGYVCNAPPNVEAASGKCAAVCNPTAVTVAAGACGTSFSCFPYEGYFGAPPVAGLCDATCNALTQTRDYDSAANCGSTSGNAMGCYGTPSQDAHPTQFTCQRVFHSNLMSDAIAYDPAIGGNAVNGCAPGYEPLLFQNQAAQTANDQMKVICVALCQPGDTSSAAPANAKGLVGSGHTCPNAGAGGNHECRYWWMIEGPNTPRSTFSNSVGYCVDYTLYTYDPAAFGMAGSPMTWPSCTALSPTAHNFDPIMSDAKVWGCVSTSAQ
jgi:hypothetical protein